MVKRFTFQKAHWDNFFGSYTTPRDFKSGARDIPFGMGSKSLYVDGVNGDDHNDGESWKTPFKTIQAAVDAAASWTNIFIKGSLTENVLVVSKHHLSLIGESSETALITAPTEGDNAKARSAIVFENSLFGSVSSLKVTADQGYGIYPIASHHLSIDDCILFGCESGIRPYNSNWVSVSNSDIDGNGKDNIGGGIWVYGSSERFLLVDSLVHNYGTSGGSAACYGAFINHNYAKIFGCDFYDIYWTAIQTYSSVTKATIFHNNFESITHDCIITGSGPAVFENYFDSHSNIDNGFGIATSPYLFTGGSDPRPVICRNGWNSISVQRSLLRKKTAAQTMQAATDANGTTWVDLKTITPTTSDIELYQLKMTTAGSWAGNAKYRIIVGSTKVYPFAADKNISSGTLESFIFPINIRINETAKIQFRSDNAGDGAGDTVTLDQLDYSEVV